MTPSPVLPGHICLTLAHFQVTSSTKTRSMKDINLGSRYTALARIHKKNKDDHAEMPEKTSCDKQSHLPLQQAHNKSGP